MTERRASTGASALIGTLSGCGSSAASVSKSRTRSSIDSPMPMIPPQHTDTPALLTCLSVCRRSSYVRVVMIEPLELARGVEVWL